MPIAYSCPHCGKQFSVAEQYAGQTGPCAACGKPITIPLPAGMPAYQPAASSQAAAWGVGAILAVVLGVGLVASVCIIAILAALLLPAVQAAREAARRTVSQNNMRQIGLALHTYHDMHGCFPPAVVRDANGKPLYSGRVLLLPMLGEQAIFDRFEKSQAWDSPQNSLISSTKIKVFCDPSAPMTPGQTDYLFVTGSQTIFEDSPQAPALRMQDITDGLSRTMAVVEVKNSGIKWAEPRDLDLSAPVSLPAGNHPRGNIVLLADGSVQFILQSDPPAEIRKLATRNGREP